MADRDILNGRMLDGQPTLFFRDPPPAAGYAIAACDHGRLYRNGELVGYAEKMVYDREVGGWWIYYEALPGRWLDRLWREKGPHRCGPNLILRAD